VFPAAACSNFTNHPQGDPGGGCLIDAPQAYQQIQPRQNSYNLFGRGTFQATQALQAYAELNYYWTESTSFTTPSTVSASVGFPGGPVSNAAVALGADHPDNPYFGTAARLRYLAADVGPRSSAINSKFGRAVIGVKGTAWDWDIDSALLYSVSKVHNTRKGFLQRNVTFALLDPTPANVAAASVNPAYAALPAGTVWRIAENAGLNSPAVYAALAPAIRDDAESRITQIDFKGTREFTQFQLPGGALGVAAGAEFRHERTELSPTTGTETGNIIGLGYSAYSGKRDATALYAEVLAPVIKTVELSGALRYDHFSDVGNSYTPKLGITWTPLRELALRGTFAKGFRAPSAAENGVGGLAAFSTATDPVRCRLGVASACDPASIAIITSPNPALSPERSKSWSVGAIWDPLPRTNISLDFWQIKRKNEINQEQTDAAIAAGHIARDPSTATNIPGDPGAITAVLARYVNSAQTKVRGVDLDARTAFNLGTGRGTLAMDAKWTHLFKWIRAGRHPARLRRHPWQLRRHQLHRHAGRPGQPGRHLGPGAMARLGHDQLPGADQEHLVQERPGRLRVSLRRRARRAQRLRNRLVYHARPDGALGAGPADRAVRHHPERVRQDRAARSADLRGDLVQPARLQRRTGPLLQRRGAAPVLIAHPGAKNRGLYPGAENRGLNPGTENRGLTRGVRPQNLAPQGSGILK
jgi:iron complex outermembrane receptor protein